MKKLLKAAAVLAAILIPSLGLAQQTTIVADGTSTNNYVPVYGFYADAYLRCQSIYPATMLEDLSSGDLITGLTFFASTPNVNWGSASFEVKLSEVASTTLSSFNSGASTTVYSGSLSIVGGEMVINLTTPYLYGGGNLMVEIVSTTTGSYVTSTYYGVSASGTTVQGYSYSGVSEISATQRNFLAKMEIAFSSDGSYCPKPQQVAASNVTSSSATVSWRSNTNHIGYTLYYHTSNFDPDSSTEAISVSLTDTTYDFSNLDPTTNYYVKVKSSCIDGGESGYASVMFRTTGIPYSDGFPYSTGFEENDDQGWEFANSSTNAWVIGTATSNGDSTSLYISNDNGVSNAYTVSGIQMSYAYRTIEFDQAGEYIISFDWKTYGEGSYDYLRAWLAPASFQFTAGQLPDGSTSSNNYQTTNPEGWIDLGGKMNLQNNWQTKQTIFTLTTTGVYNLVFMWANDNSAGTNPPAAVDNIILTQLSCPAPINLTFETADETSLTVSWQSVGTESEWAVRINGGTWDSSTDTVYTFTNLQANTAYNVEVMAVCGTDDSSFVISGTFNTSCGIMQAPYTTSFEGYTTGQMPDCWLQAQTGTSGSGTFPSIYNHSNARTGGAYFEFESNNGHTELAALPQMENISQLALTFYASLMSHNFVLEAGVMEGSTFVPVDTIDNMIVGSDNNWHGSYNPYTVYYANYSGTGDRLAMRVTATGSYTLMIDDLSVDEFTGCYPVSNLTATDIDSASITLAWEDDLNGGASYIVYYWTDGGDTTVEYVNDTTITILGLGGNTMYYFDVVADCGDGESSAVSGNWRTECGSTAIPFTEGFEGLTTGVPPTCWSVLNGNPRVMSSYPHTGSRHLYFSGATPNTIAMPTMAMPTGQLQIRFWTRPEGNTYSSCGSFAVGYMTDLNVDSTYVQLASWSYSEWTSNDYVEKEVPMIGAPDTAFIVLRHNSGSSIYYWYVDDIVVEPIPACNHPVSISASNVTSTDADITILGTENASYRLYWTDGITTDSTDLTGINTYSFTGLTASTTYTVTAATICDDGTLTSTVSTSFRTECGGGNCDVVINMEDSYGDGWNGAAINGYIAGTQVFSATLSTGSTGTFTYSLCSTDTLQLRWEEGNFDSETSFTITDGGETIASGDGDDYNDNELIGTANGCPNCLAPSSLMATSVNDNEITVTFGGSQSNGYIIVITDGQGYTDTVNISNDTAYTFTGLNSTTTYQISIYSDCGDGETSNPRNLTVSTTAVATPLPYTTGFETGDDLGWLLVNGTETNAWYIGSAASNGGSQALYISNDGGTSNQYSIGSESFSYATKLLAFDSIGDYVINFDWRCLGESQYYDWLRVFLAPASAQLSAGSAMPLGEDTYDAAITSVPAGWLDLTGHSSSPYTLNQSSNWNNLTQTFTITATGNYNLVFMWANDGSVGTNPPAAVDNVQVGRLSCPAPQNIVFDNIGSSSAAFHWTPAGNETEWEVTVDGVTSLVYTTSHSVSGLSAMTDYNVAVRAVCGVGDTSFATGANFTTAMCDNAVTMENFDTTMASATSSYSPIGYAFYNYSYVQTIIPASMLDASATEITALAFLPANTTSSSYFTNMDVYMANVSEDAFSSTDFIHPDSVHTFVQVIANGNFNYTNTDWQVQGFDNNFTWDGQSNILVAVNRRHGSYSSGASFVAHTDTAYRILYKYTDGSAFDINTVSSGSRSMTVGDLRLISCGAGCAKPTVSLSNIDAQSASITAHGSGILYELRYGTSDDNLNNTLTSTTGIFNLTGLQSETTYYYAVRQQCDTALFSNWAEGYFTTLDLGCLPPTGLNVVATGYTAVTLGWTPGNDETAWEVHIFSNTTDRLVTVTSNPATVDSLDADMPYSAAVRSLCGVSNNVPGPWSDTVTFSTNACQAVTNVTVTAGSTTATVTWTATGADSYRVVWGEQPLNLTDLLGEQTVTTNSYTITGLTPVTNYAVVVFNNCAAGLSIPSTPTNFTTVSGGSEPTMYTITATANNPAWGSVTGGGTYAEGTNVTLTATANQGYHFEMWNDGVTEAIRTITVNGNDSYTANFAEDGSQTVYYTVTVTSVNPEWGSVSGGGQYAEGSTATIAATPAEGYQFVEWNDHNTDNPRNITVTGDTSFTASFEAAPEGIGDVSLGTVSLYPNPASTSVTLGLNGFEGRVSIDVVDLNGRVVYTTVTTSSAFSIDVRNIPQGAYFVRVTSERQTAVSKLIVK